MCKKPDPAGSCQTRVPQVPQKVAIDQTAGVGRAGPALRLAADQSDVGLVHPEAHAENPSGLPLAFIAMADRQPYGFAYKAVADLAAPTTTFRRKRK